MPKVNFHSDAVPLIPFDPAKAKELVQKSGYDGKPIKIMIDTGNALAPGGDHSSTGLECCRYQE